MLAETRDNIVKTLQGIKTEKVKQANLKYTNDVKQNVFHECKTKLILIGIGQIEAWCYLYTRNSKLHKIFLFEGYIMYILILQYKGDGERNSYKYLNYGNHNT